MALVGTSPSDVVVMEPLPPFDGVEFSTVAEDENGKPKPGRPRKPIDVEVVERMAALGMTDEEMAGSYGVSTRQFSARKKLDSKFAVAVANGRARYKAKIRSHIDKHVDAGNWEAVRWLSINELGMRRNPETRDSPPEVSGASPLLEKLMNLEEGLVRGHVAAADVAADEEKAG